MANICSNMYRFIFSDGEKAEKFLGFINSSDPDKSVYNLGVKAGIKNAEGRDVREWVANAYAVPSSNSREIFVATDSKWTPCPNAWQDIARTFDEGVTVYYEAEEPGCGIFASNDPNYVGSFIIDVCYNRDLPEGVDLKWGPNTREKTISALQKLLGTDEGDLSLLLHKLGKSKYRRAVCVHEIEHLSISDWAE